MTNEEVGKLQEGLEKCLDLKGVKFAYAVLKNLKKCDLIIKKANEKIQKIIEPSEKYIEFEQARVVIAEKCSKKDADGDPVKTFNYSINPPREQFEIEDLKYFNGLLEPLKKKYAKAIKEHEKKMDDAKAVTKEEVELEIHMIDEDLLPEDITATQLDGIEKIIKTKN